ncbi:hypothetical protein K431DRAFT_347705 [Polychaeton citri CBS 116435]|uniref:Uncharacterized protein n=1 Tax=Polychaeton citri CBS 116435 TaxID=1314669 RepID=A0A9P4Q7I0_9PEZI|nr:hypothetical protein K431DRAFT_347705 [Polychaeton citri CBS 116435]
MRISQASNSNMLLSLFTAATLTPSAFGWGVDFWSQGYNYCGGCSNSTAIGTSSSSSNTSAPVTCDPTPQQYAEYAGFGSMRTAGRCYQVGAPIPDPYKTTDTCEWQVGYSTSHCTEPFLAPAASIRVSELTKCRWFSDSECQFELVDPATGRGGVEAGTALEEGGSYSVCVPSAIPRDAFWFQCWDVEE